MNPIFLRGGRILRSPKVKLPENHDPAIAAHDTSESDAKTGSNADK